MKRLIQKKLVGTFFVLLTILSHGKELPYVPVDSLLVPDGYEVKLWAKSPLFYNPTNMDIDHHGRVWVAEGRNYRMFRNKKIYKGDPKGDRIMVLTDSDGDGQADKSHIFVQDIELVAPLGVAVIDNKVVVSQPPNLLVYTDVDRNAVFDPKVDKKEAILTGFGGRDHDHSLHAVTTGPSGQWYFNTGNAGTHIVEDKEGWNLRVGSVYKGGSPSVTRKGPNQGGQPGLKSDDGIVYVGSVALRMNPDGTGLRPIGHNMRNSYEETVNSFGDVFQNDNDDPPACRVTWLMEYGNLGFASDDGARKWQIERRPGQAAAIAEWRQEDPGTIPAGDVYGTGSPTGICFYENGSLEPKYNGLLLSGEPARNVVFGYVPKVRGAGFQLDRFDFLRTKQGEEWGEGVSEETKKIASMFRPSDVTVGPDGAIYVADWFDNGVGGHAMRDKDLSAAIYRITKKGENPRPVKFDIDTIEGQIAALKNPANNVRNMGFSRLKEAGVKALPAVKELLIQGNQYFKARAIWLLAQMGPEGIAEVESVLKQSKNQQIRIAAFRALRFVGHQKLEYARQLARDESIALRREVALALRNDSFQDTKDIILELARGYQGNDRWYLEAIGTACTGKEVEMYELLNKELGGDDGRQWTKGFAKLAWRLHPAASISGFKARAHETSLGLRERKDAMTALGFMPEKEAALAMVSIAEAGPADTKVTAKWWLQNRSTHVWKEFVSEMKGLNKKPNALQANRDYLAPIEGPEITKVTVADVLALKGDAEKGKLGIARCYMCHQVNGQGVDFGPALDDWGLGRSKEAIATAIVEPSKAIAHGFEAKEMITKDGFRIQGFPLFTGGEHIYKIMGGQEIKVSRSLIKETKSLTKSLMMSAGQMAMSSQDVADVVAYLKTSGGKAGAKEAKQQEEGRENAGPTLGIQPISSKSSNPAKPTATKKQKQKQKLILKAFDTTKPVKPIPEGFNVNDRFAGISEENAPPVKWSGDKRKKRILFLAGDTTHNHGYHEYKAGSILLANALNESGLPVEARVNWFKWPEDESCFDGVDVCVVFADKAGSFSAENFAFLDKKFKEGMGIVMMHFALHPDKKIGEKYYIPWIGAYFDDDTTVNPTWLAELTLNKNHPSSNGIEKPITLYDESYFCMKFSEREDVYPLAEAIPTEQNMIRYGSDKYWNKGAVEKLGQPVPLLWCSDPKEGARGAGFVGAHYHWNWVIDDFRKLILNTIIWVAKEEVPAKGVISNKVTKAMLNANLNRPDFPYEVMMPDFEVISAQPAGKPPVLGPDGRTVPRNKRKK